MLGAGVPPISPLPVEGDGSWVWVLVAIGVVVGALALLWLARLWGHHGRIEAETWSRPRPTARCASGGNA